MRVLIFDTESEELEGNRGVLLSSHFVVWDEEGRNRPYHFKITPRQAREMDDRELAVLIRDELEAANVIVGFNSKEHDLRLLNSRLAFWGERICEPQMHLDLYHIAAFHFKNRGKSLKVLAEHLGVGQKKTPVTVLVWKRAIRGSRADLAQVVEHGDADVLITRAVYDKLRPLLRNVHR